MLRKIIRIIKIQCKKLIEKVKSKIEPLKNDVFKLISIYKNLPLTLKVISGVLFLMLLEALIVTPIQMYKIYDKNKTDNLIEYKKIIGGVDNNLTLNSFLKENISFIDNILIYANAKSYCNLVITMSNGYNKNTIIKDIPTSKEIGDGIVKDSNLEVIEHNSIEKKEIYIYLFNHINTFSFMSHYEPILINGNVKYSWSDDKIKKSPYIFTNLIMENLFRVILILVFLFLFEKQGLLGNKDKYSIVYPHEVDTDFRNLLGMEDIKREIYILADLIKHRSKYKDFGIEKTFNYLFSGPPGTGKTQIASGLAKLLQIPMVVGTGNVETGFINGGVSVIQELFKTARKEALKNKHKMAMIFLDEAQNLMVKRGQGRDKWTDDSANELLAQLDGIHSYDDVSIIFVAASNFDDKNHQFDEAMMRRFKKKLFFRLPNLEERRDILEYYLSKVNKKYICKNIDLNYIADITSNLSPAMLEMIVQEASLLSITQNKNLIEYENEKPKKIKELFLNNNKNDDDLFYDSISILDTRLLEKAFEIISVGHTDRNVTKNKEVQRNIISKHELGHFICEMQSVLNKKYSKTHIENDIQYIDFGKDLYSNLKYLKENLKVLKISVESISQINALGYVLNKKDDVMLRSKKELEEEIISLYGGLASETVFSKHSYDITTGSSNDIEKVSNLFNIMVNKLGMYTNSKLNLNLIDNFDNKKVNSKIIIEKSEELFKVSTKYVTHYIELIEFLNEILLEKYVLNLDEILSYIKEFYDSKGYSDEKK